MNVEDFKDVEIPEGDMLETVFDHQRQLMNRYHIIEQTNVGHHIPSAPGKLGEHDGALDMQDRASQLRCKSFAWRVTEEITEATICLIPGDVNETHYYEELVDALHFSVELLLMSGIQESTLMSGAKDRMICLFDGSKVLFDGAGISPMTSKDLIDPLKQKVLRSAAYDVIERVGEACNRLKSKEWKTTPMLTDVAAYRKSIVEFFQSLIDLLALSGFDAKSVTAMYLRKNAVNKFRIGSNY
jgi:dimeric dUTPase (all-alpha-NTP-PPase superfamily)